MRKRIILIACAVCAVAGTGIIWMVLAGGQSNNNQAKPPTDEEKILELAKQDPVAGEYGIAASSVEVIKKEGSWYVAAITYLYSSTNTYATYPSILLRDTGGDFSIVVGFNDFTTLNRLIENGIPPSIARAAIGAFPAPEVPEDTAS